MASQRSNSNFWTGRGASLSRFPLLGKEQKEQLAVEGTPFTIRAIRDTTSQYGPTWMLDIELDGRMATLAMGHNTGRDPVMLAMQEHIAEFPNTGVAASLDYYTNDFGPVFVIVPPTENRPALPSQLPFPQELEAETGKLATPYEAPFGVPRGN